MSKTNKFKTVPLSEMIISINTGLNPRNNFQLNEDSADCFYFNIRNFRKTAETSFDMISAQTMNMIKKKCKLEKGDILVPAILTKPYHIMMVTDITSNIGISENVYAIKPKDDATGEYLYYILQTTFIQKQLEDITNNNSLTRITKNMLKNIAIPMADEMEKNHITNTMKQLDMINKDMIIIQTIANHFFDGCIKYDDTENTICFPDFFNTEFQNHINKISKMSSMLTKQVDKVFNYAMDRNIKNEEER